MQRASVIRTLTVLGALALVLSGAALAQVDLAAGDDAWQTPPGGTALDFAQAPLPAGFFGTGSLAFAQAVTFFGVPITTSPAGALGSADTLVRRLSNTGPMTIGSSALIGIEFVALHLESDPFTVNYSGGGSETWKLVAGLSKSSAQTTGAMNIHLTHANGGTFDSLLYAKLLLRFERITPSPSTITLDCGAGAGCQLDFITVGAAWTLVGGPAGFTRASQFIDPLPSGVNLDCDADGTVDGTLTIGSTSFQAGFDITAGGGGGGGGECDGASHIHGQSQIETHTSYLSGDPDVDGVPDANGCDNCPGIFNPDQADCDGDGMGDVCDDCCDANSDGVDDVTGRVCDPVSCKDRDNDGRDDDTYVTCDDAEIIGIGRH